MPLPRPPAPPRRRLAAPVFALVAALVLAACQGEVPDPSRQSIVPADWGATLQPRDVDLLYLPGGSTGCPGRLTPNDPCGGSHTLDIYPATRGTPTGTLVWVHGGGFVGGEKYPLLDLGPFKRLTHLGWSVVAANYRMADAPGGQFPTAVQDVAAALRWVRTNGGTYGLNTRRIVVAGYSAGGTIAGLVGTTGNSGDPRFAGIPPLSGWISFGGILDFNAGPLSNFWGSAWRLTPSDRIAASTHTWWDRADPQGWLIQGDLDNTVEYSTSNALMARAAASGRVQRDTADRFSDGTFMDTLARGHRLGIGMNSDALVSWLASLPTLDPQASPLGSLDVVSASESGVRVAGWALDPDTTAPIDVRLTVDGTLRTTVSATARRGDVGRAYPLHGPNHGFDLTLEGLAAGQRQVCAYAVNVGLGTANTPLGCRTVTVTAG